MVVALGAGYPPPGRATTTTSAASTSAKGSAGKPASGSAASGSTPAATPSQTAAWDAVVAQARSNSPQPTAPVLPGENLTVIADLYGVPLSTVEKDNPQIVPPNYVVRPGDQLKLPKRTPAQVVPPFDNSQVKPIIFAYADAEGFDKDHDISGLHDEPPGALGGFQKAELAQSDKNWDAVTQATYNALTSNPLGGAGVTYPDVAACKEVAELDALEPGNAQFAAANKAALAEADKQWTTLGITSGQLKPIIAAYNNVKQATNAVGETQANNALTAAIEKALNTAVAAATQGSDLQARSQTITQAAAFIQIFGPQDPAFQKAVDQANLDVQVDPLAQRVADAYAKGRAVAGANELLSLTKGVANAYYASQIILASQATIDKIGKDLGALAASPTSGIGANPFGSESLRGNFFEIYNDLSQSVATANPYTGAKTLSADGKAAADAVADAIASDAPNVPSDMESSYVGLYSLLADVTTTDGGVLSLATAAALHQQGNSKLAALVTSGLTAGYTTLASVTKSDVQKLGSAFSTLFTLQANWGRLFPPGGLAKATSGYLADNPDIVKQADAALAAVSQDGDSIAPAIPAWNTYKGQLGGVTGFGDLSKAATGLTGNNPYTAFATSQSQSVANAAAAALAGVPSSGQGSGSVAKGLLAAPLWTILRGARRFSNNLLKYLDTLRNDGKLSSDLTPTGVYTALSVVGLAEAVENSAVNVGWFNPDSAQDAFNSVYDNLGYIKFGTEIIEGFGKANVSKAILSGLGVSDAKSDAIRDSLSTLTKNSSLYYFTNFGFFASNAAALAFEALQDFNNGDQPDGYITSVQAAGAAGRAFTSLNIAKSVFPDAADAAAAGTEVVTFGSIDVTVSLLGAAFTGIGFLAAVAGGINAAVKDAGAVSRLNNDTTAFVQQGFGLSPGFARTLAVPPGAGSGDAVRTALVAYANYYQISPQQLLQNLNNEYSKNPIAVDLFINQAALIPQPGGKPQIKGPYDSPARVQWEEVSPVPQKFPEDADSLVQLHYWAEDLFPHGLR